MRFKKGDLIVMDRPAGSDFASSGWRSGFHDKTGKTGDFPTDNVYVLPTLTKPPQELVVSILDFL